MSHYALPGSPMHLGRRGFALFLAAQAAVLAAALFVADQELLFILLGGAVAILYLALVLVYPWLVIPLVVGTTTLDITGIIVKDTPLGIPITGFHLTLGLMLVAVVANLALHRRTRLPGLSLGWPLLAFLGLVALSLTYSPNQPEATISFVRFCFLAIFLYFTYLMIDSRKAVHLVAASMGVALLGVSTLGILQVLTQKFYLPASFVLAVGANAPRATGTFHNPNHLGTFLMAGIVFLLPILVNYHMSRWKQLGAVLAIGVSLAGLITTFSRANWLAGLVGVLLALALSGKLRLRHAFNFLFFSAVLVLLLKEFVPFAEHIFLRFVSIFTLFTEFSSVGQVSSSARVYFVLAGLGMFLDNPLLGAGWRAFPVLLNAYKPEGFPHWIPTQESHTLFATILAELGLVGALLSLWVLWRVLVPAFRSLRQMQDPYLRTVLISLISLFVAFHISVSFTADFDNNYFWFFTGMIFAVIRLEQEARSA